MNPSTSRIRFFFFDLLLPLLQLHLRKDSRRGIRNMEYPLINIARDSASPFSTNICTYTASSSPPFVPLNTQVKHTPIIRQKPPFKS